MGVVDSGHGDPSSWIDEGMKFVVCGNVGDNGGHLVSNIVVAREFCGGSW